MNERIKELWNESRSIAIDRVKDFVSSEAQAEVFAELIIKDCMQTVTELRDEYYAAGKYHNESNEDQCKALAIAMLRLNARLRS
jgi:hypothetical protein